MYMTMEFDFFWTDISNNNILGYNNSKILYEQMLETKSISGYTAEIGVYQGHTSKLIKMVLGKPHYCYDTFEGVVSADSNYGDTHKNGEFICNLQDVQKNINMPDVFYKKGFFPETFGEQSIQFCFVYSDTATYLGAKSTFECFAPLMVSGGKIIFYIDDKCSGVKNAIREFLYNAAFCVSYIGCFVCFTKIDRC